MSGHSCRKSLLVYGAAVAGAFLCSAAVAQEVIWDRQVTVGNLVAFPSAYDPTRYYYAGTRARLARERGLPKFSFVRFVRENPDGGEAIGGGIIHALVELGVSDEDKRAAEDALRDIDGDATLAGPVAFTAGTFTLISTAMDDETNEIARRVIGLGKAPLLEGDRAAISMLLTATGANSLWATFNTPTPDVTFSFNMDVDAYRSPIQAKVEASWDKIYEHENFQAALRAGVDSSSVQAMLGGEIDLTYEDLTQSGAIKITILGEDESLERATEAAYEDLREVMFTPANMAGTENFTPDYADSAYSRASEMYDKAEANRQKRNDDARNRRDEAENARAECAKATASNESQSEDIQQLEEDAKAADEAAETAQDQLEGRLPSIEDAIREATINCPDTPENCRVTISNLTEARARMEAEVERARRAAQSAQDRLISARSGSADRSGDQAGSCSEADQLAEEAEWEQGTQVTVSAYVAYRIKQVKQSGTFIQDMTKYKADTFTLRFDSNIGDLRTYLTDENIFAVVPDDPLAFGQHNVYVDVSGIGDTDFGDFLTSTSIELRKTHQNGAVSRDSVRLSKATFTDPVVRMAYISRGDTDADAFKTYQYKIDWNYAGNVKIAGDWIESSGDSIPASPPLTRQSIRFRLDPSFVDELGIVGVTIRTFGVYGSQRGVGPVLTLEPDSGDTGYSASGHILVDPKTGLVDYTADFTLANGGTERIEGQTTSAIVVLARL